MRIHPFQGTRYTRLHGEPGRFAAPPYDQIDDELRDRLQAEPFSFAHLLRPNPPAGRDPFVHAADLHRQWLETGTIATDAEPALYPYEIVLARGGRRLGLTTLVGIEPPEAGVIRPHELTVEKTVDERLRLLRAMQTDIGPILLLSDDGGSLDERLAEDIEGSEPVAEHVDAQGNRHRLFRVASAERTVRYQKLLAEVPGLIADGHHRYRTASIYAAEVGAMRGSVSAAKLAVVTSLGSPGLAIDPIHRGLSLPVGVDSPSAAILDRLPCAARDGATLAEAVEAARQPAVGVLTTGQPPEIWLLDSETGPSELPEAASELPVVLLHFSLFPVFGLTAGAATDGTVLYRSDPDVLWRSVSAGEMSAGFFLPPMLPTTFGAAIEGGHILPPKSTRFLPKLVSGLVWAGHGAAIR